MANYNRLIPYNLFKISAACLLALVCAVAFAQTPDSKNLLKVLKKTVDPDSAANYGRELIALAKKHNDPLFEAQVLYLRSFQLYKNGDEKQALVLARQSNKLTSPVDSFTYVKSSTMIAYMLSRRGDDVEALKVAFDILRKADTKGWKSLSADCRLCIADLYRSIDKSQQALPYAEQAAKDVLSVRDTAMYIFALSTLSNLYSNSGMQTPGNMAKAAEYMEIILNKPYVDKLSMFERSRYLSNLGRIYEINNKLDKAEKVLLEAVEICRKGQFPAIEKHALNELSTVKIDQGRYREAIMYAKQALAVQADAQSSRINQRNIYRRLRDAYEGLHDYKNAYKYAEEARMLNDSILEQDKAREASELSEKYKLDKRLVETRAATKIARQQRNFIIILGGILVVSAIAVYRWLSYRRKKEADLLLREKQQLERLDGMKSKFFANISHELRTPLTLIMGPLNEVINNATLAEEHQQKHLQTVWRNSKKLLGMVNELLDLGKIEAGKLPVKTQLVALKQFVIMLYQGFASAAEHKNVRYSIICNIDETLVAGTDREKLEKIINNLLGNAVKYTPSQGAVYVNASVVNNVFEFSVANSGTGIHPDDLPHIFERYYQGNREGAMAEGGTGIGLALAKEFTELLAGEIKVENDHGRGTLFKVNLPIAIATEAVGAEDVTAEPETTLQQAETVAGGATILLVEDHPEMASYITSLLNTHYNVVMALNGTDALEKLEAMNDLPSLIISDVMMPGMDGFTLLKHLKQHDRYHRIPVVMLTALADAENRLTALNTGVDDYITKPFVGDELMARVNNLLSNAAKRYQADETDVQSALEEDILQSSPADLLWLAEVEKFVRNNVGKTDLNLTALSYDMAISERQLNRRIKSITGLTPNRYIRAIRLQIAREAIESGKYRTVAEIAYAAGFETPAYFSKLFKEHYGRDVNSLL